MNFHIVNTVRGGGGGEEIPYKVEISLKETIWGT